MTKFFKGTMEPKKGFLKTNPDATAIVVTSDQHDTQADFKIELIESLKDEGMESDYFAPKIERIDETEFKKLNSESPGDCADYEDQHGTHQAIDYENKINEIVVDTDRRGFDINSETGEVKIEQEAQVIYRYFEFVPGYAVIIKTEYDVFSGRWVGSFTYLRGGFYCELAGRYSSDENAAINTIGHYIEYLNKLKSESDSGGEPVEHWYKKTVLGLASSPDTRLINSIISNAEYNTIVGQMELDLNGKSGSDEKFLKIIDAVKKHRTIREFGPEKHVQIFIDKVKDNIIEAFSDATQQQINQAAETVESMASIRALDNPEIFIDAFEIIINDAITKSESFERKPLISECQSENMRKLGGMFNNEEIAPDNKAEISEIKVQDSVESSGCATVIEEKTENEAPESSNFDNQVIEINEKLNALLPGELLVIEDLPNDVYHASNGISSTKLKVAMESLMKFDAKFVSKTIPEKGKEDHFDLGKLFHTMTLEPHLVDVEYIMEPEGFKKPTSPQREKYDEWVKLGCPDEKENKKAYPTELMFKLCKAEDDLIKDASGRCIVSYENWQKAQVMADAVRNDPDSGSLVCHTGLRCETSYFKRDEGTGLIIKCRPDAELGSVVADLKSISLRSNPDEDYLINALRREVLNRGYHVSAAMYLDITGKNQFMWIFTNTEEGYHWSAPIIASERILYGDDEGKFIGGYELYRRYLKAIAHGYDTGEWAKPISIQIRYENGVAIIPEI